jgi:hypothetical protein
MKNPGHLVMQPPEQMRYAAWLDWAARLGLAALLLSFAADVLGLVEPHVPSSLLPQLWTHSVRRFVELTGSPTGWGWLALIHRSDIAGLIGIAILAGSSVLCVLVLVPLYLKRGDRAYAALSLSQVMVVLLAASGALSGRL